MTNDRLGRGCDHIDRRHRTYADGRRWGDQPGELARPVGFQPT